MKGMLLWLVFGLAVASAKPPAVDAGAGEVVVEQDTGAVGEGVVGGQSRWQAIPEAHRKAYFEKKPEGFLVDPQRLLSPVVRRDRSAFLEYHAGDSSIDLHVYILGGEQEVPEVSQCEKVMSTYFSGSKPSAVVWYPHGAPDRTAMYLSPALRERVPDAETKRALASSMMQALEKADPAGQLEAFLVQMSIRLYWMEKLIGGQDTAEPVDEAAVVAVVVPKMEEKPEVGLSERLRPVSEMVSEAGMEAVVVLGVCVLLLGVMVLLRLRARHVLPDFSVEPRLGGEHGAGVGAVISFASASVPPASQRERLG